MKPSRLVPWTFASLLIACLEGDPNPYEREMGGSAATGAVGSSTGGSGGSSAATCSMEAVTPVTVTFVNGYPDRSVSLNWVDYNCAEIQYGVIGPGTSQTQMTFVSHMWRLRDVGSGTLLREFTAANAAQVMVTVP